MKKTHTHTKKIQRFATKGIILGLTIDSQDYYLIIHIICAYYKFMYQPKAQSSTIRPTDFDITYWKLFHWKSDIVSYGFLFLPDFSDCMITKIS